MEINKTIVALVTAPITQNLAIIRISGPNTYFIVKKIFSPSKLLVRGTNQNLVGKIFDLKKELIDQVVMLCFYKPKSFTGEDLVEINLHGNLIIVNRVLELLLSQGASLAQNGEFSKQAFFNGKISLTQANAINELIRAPNVISANLALENLGKDSQIWIKDIEDKLLNVIANIKVNIDYPEYDGISYLTRDSVIELLKNFNEKLTKVINKSQKARFYQQGFSLAVVGKPNVGKSTFFNSMLDRERSIVTEQAGTTRDSIEANFQLKGIPLVLIDTAGIRKTNDLVEEIGINKTHEVLEKADFVFFLVDASRPWDKEDEFIYELVKPKKHLVLLNKMDKINYSTEKLENFTKNLSNSSQLIVPISAKNKDFVSLEKKFLAQFSEHFFLKNEENVPFLLSSWQIANLEMLKKKLHLVKNSLQRGHYLDAICGELEKAYDVLQEILGKSQNVELIDIIFSKFCLGK